MQLKTVLSLYNQFENNNIKIWIDGGWCVDALLGKQLRPHNDLDIAINWKAVPKLRELLEKDGYKQIKEDSKWNFVLGDNIGNKLDVHAFVCDVNGSIIDGIMYPAESLTGTGVIDGQTVRCIAPQYMIEFLSPWIHKWPGKYVEAVKLLCEKFKLDLPKEYLNYKK